MKLIWHVGPHKTATTALQTALHEHAQSRDAGYYYPAPATPGHSELAARFLGLEGRAAEPDLPLRAVEAAGRAGLDRVVLSSEDFAYGVTSDESLEIFRAVAREVETEVVLTLSPLPDRVLPELQETIKFGGSFQFYDVSELVALCTERPGLRPDFVARAATGIGAASTTVIHVRKDDPTAVYRGMSAVLGEVVQPPAKPVVNASMPFLRAVWFSELNRRVAVDSAEARRIVNAAYQAATRESAAPGDVAFPSLPEAFVEFLTGVWTTQLGLLEQLEQRGRVRSLH